jgi:hypothetical protein
MQPDFHRGGPCRTGFALFQATPSKSARALAQSKTLRKLVARGRGRQPLDCASALALSQEADTTLNTDAVSTARFGGLGPAKQGFGKL